MQKVSVLIATLVLIGTTTSIQAFAYNGEIDDSTQKVTKEQLERCKELSIPEFACTEHTLLARERIEKSQDKDAYGSGTPLFGTNFGEMGLFIGVLAAIFGGVAATFFARSRIGRNVPT